MTMTEPHRNRAYGADESPTMPVPLAAEKPTVLDQMGGPMGFVYSTVPGACWGSRSTRASWPGPGRRGTSS